LEVTTEGTDEARIKRRRIGEVMDSSPKVPPGKNDTILSENNTPSSSHQISVEDTWQELGITTVTELLSLYVDTAFC